MMIFNGPASGAYSNILFKDKFKVQDENQEIFTLGPSILTAGGVENGILNQYVGTYNDRYTVIDRIKVGVDPTDTADNILWFSLWTGDWALGGNLFWAMPAPLTDQTTRQALYTNFTVMVRQGYKLYVSYQCNVPTSGYPSGLPLPQTSLMWRTRDIYQVRGTVRKQV
jgi:hypothetical protein